MDIDKTIKTLEMTKINVGLPNVQGSDWSPNAETIAIDEVRFSIF